MHGIILALLLLLLPSVAWAQAGFLQAIPGTSRPLCTSITHPVTNQTWCADASGAPTQFLWKVWDGTTYAVAGGDPGAGCSFGGRVLISDASTTATVTFAVPQPDALYAVAMAIGVSAGTPPFIVPRYTSPTTVGFTIELSSGPGLGNTIAASWIVSPSSCVSPP